MHFAPITQNQIRAPLLDLLLVRVERRLPPAVGGVDRANQFLPLFLGQRQLCQIAVVLDGVERLELVRGQLRVGGHLGLDVFDGFHVGPQRLVQLTAQLRVGGLEILGQVIQPAQRRGNPVQVDDGHPAGRGAGLRETGGQREAQRAKYGCQKAIRPMVHGSPFHGERNWSPPWAGNPESQID